MRVLEASKTCQQISNGSDVLEFVMNELTHEFSDGDPIARDGQAVVGSGRPRKMQVVVVDIAESTGIRRSIRVFLSALSEELSKVLHRSGSGFAALTRALMNDRYAEGRNGTRWVT